MERKYYTPTIEEFHVGFEYEQYVIALRSEDDKPSAWVKMKIQILEDLMECDNNLALEGNIDAKYCRVKLLDREDIESLGFEFSHRFSVDTNYEVYKGHGCILDFYPERHSISIDGQGFKPSVIGLSIKNKSELQKLMIQLGIK